MCRKGLIIRVAATVAGIACFVGGANTRVQAQCHGGHEGHSSHAGHDDTHSNHGPYQTAGVSIVERPPHGGQVYHNFLYYFEVVYEPRETHVYLYGPGQEPLPSQNVRGQVAMQPHYAQQAFRFSLTFAAGQHPNHLVALVDVSGVPEGQMTVTFTFDNLPFQQQPEATFSQTFVLTQARPQVLAAVLTEADRPGIERQQVCPVTRAELGSMGPPVKLLIGDLPLYLCCQACVAKVQQNPQSYLPPPGATPIQPFVGQPQPPAVQPQPLLNQPQSLSGGPPPEVNRLHPQILVALATAADEAEIRAQRECPVLRSPLGQHGAPIKVTINGQSLFVCCQGCIAPIERNPDFYLVQAAQLRANPR